MAKRVQKEHAARRGELLEVARGLFIRDGYDATPINEILKAAGIAKGTFYHYFNSKEDLLDALVEQMTEKILAEMQKAIRQDGLDPIGRLNAYFHASARWKALNREALMAIVRPLYSSRNLLLRHKMAERTMALCRDDLEAIIAEGVREGVFDTESPAEAAELVLGMASAMRETNAKLFLEMEEKPENWEILERKINFYERSIERILGAPAGSIQTMDEEARRVFRPAER